MVYNPLDVSSFFINTSIGSLVSIKSAGIIGSLVIAFTQLVLRPIFNIRTFTRLSFLSWIVLEFILLSSVMYYFYGERGRPFMDEFGVVARMTLTLAIIPYSFACLFLNIIQRSRKVDENARMQEPHEENQFAQLLTLKDQNGKVMLTLKTKDLVYLKSEDNYIQVAYLHDDQIRKKLIRNNLKTIEHELQPKEFLRIHRSYMINLRNIDNVKRDRSRLHVQMSHLPGELFPVSSSYKDLLESAISDLS